MPNKVITYDEVHDPEDQLKISNSCKSGTLGNAYMVPHGIPSKLPSAKEVHQGSDRDPPHQEERRGIQGRFHAKVFGAESRHVKGVLKCMRIYGFMHGITNPKLIKHLHENIPKSVDEIMRVTIAFLRGEVAASNQARRKALPVWK
ncbi:hypothetical protein Tco_0810827 [Tanacetum coccineum]